MEKRILICTNRRLTDRSPSCAGAGAEAIADELERLIAERGLAVPIERSGCLGRCNEGPNLRFAPAGEFLGALTRDSLPDILLRLEGFLKAPKPL